MAACPVRIETLSGVVADTNRSVAEKKTSRRPFQFRDIRRTFETMLAGIGVSRDVRAEILSHGLGGVQDRHYMDTITWTKAASARKLGCPAGCYRERRPP